MRQLSTRVNSISPVISFCAPQWTRMRRTAITRGMVGRIVCVSRSTQRSVSGQSHGHDFCVAGKSYTGIGLSYLDRHGLFVFVDLDAGDSLPMQRSGRHGVYSRVRRRERAEECEHDSKLRVSTSIDAKTLSTSSRASSGTHVKRTNRPEN